MAGPRFLFFDAPDKLARQLAEFMPRPTAIVGVGLPLCGDDGFGPAVVARLERSDRLVPFDVQGVPESFLGPIVASGCPGVLFVDAADLGAAPGRVAIVRPEAIAEVDVSTHVVSLGLAAEAIKALAREARGGADVVCALLAAQPQALKEVDRMSPAMEEAVGLAAAGIDAFARLRSGPEGPRP